LKNNLFLIENRFLRVKYTLQAIAITKPDIPKGNSSMKKSTYTISCALILLLLSLTQLRTAAKAATSTIRVPQDYRTIQEAINHATDGETIQISTGTYSENVIVNKTVSLIGENRTSTIVDGGRTETVIYVKANNVVISGFTVQNGYSGIWLFFSENCTISEINAKKNAYGIKLYHSSNCTLRENSVSNNEWFGIVLDNSGNCILRGNTLVDNNFNFGVDGATLHDFVNDIDTSNTVNGKPIYYLINQNNLTIDPSTLTEIGYMAFVNSTNISAKDLTLTRNVQGILFAYTPNSTISNINASDNWNGIYLKGSSGCQINDNNPSNNFDYGIAIRLSGNCTINRNNVTNNNWGGISLGSSWNCRVFGNNVTDSYYGIHLVDSTDCVVTGNEVSKGNSAYSIVIYRSYNNLIYHNNFINHFIHAYGRSDNIWDNGLEGNSWSGYNGTDVNQDGIGDTPYVLDENNRDNCPLMGTFHEFTVSNKEETHSITIISNSTISNFGLGIVPDDKLRKIISFNVTGQDNTICFCRIMIPHTLMDGNYTVLIDGSPVFHKNLSCSNSTNSYIYFTYPHAEHEVMVIHEFPCLLILLLTIVITSFMAAVHAKNRRKSF